MGKLLILILLKLRYLCDLNACFVINDLNSLVQKFFKLEKTDALDLLLATSLSAKKDDLEVNDREEILDVATIFDVQPFLGKRYAHTRIPLPSMKNCILLLCMLPI